MSSEAAQRAAEAIWDINEKDDGITLTPMGMAKIIDEEMTKPGDPFYYSVDSFTGEVKGIWNSETGEVDPLPEGHVVDICYGQETRHGGRDGK